MQFAARQVIIYIRSVDFQVKSDMFTTEKHLPFTDEETDASMRTAPAPLSIALRNTRLHTTSSKRIDKPDVL